jgi:ribulose-phosphate 3-epimerase
VSWTEWAREVEIEPSVYAADFARLGEQVEALLEAGARVFHVDIGDGHFIPPVTIGSVVVEALAPLVQGRGGRLDCHLMVTNPDEQIPIVAASGADSVTFHIETSENAEATVASARDLGVQVGVTLNPATPVTALAPVRDAIDLALLMSVVPGYSGQSFLPDSLERLRELRELVSPRCKVQVDGGIGHENAGAAREAGADLLVAGSSIFGADDLAQAYRELVALTD